MTPIAAAAAMASLPLGGEVTLNGVTYRKVLLRNGRGSSPEASCPMCPLVGRYPDPCDTLWETRGGIRPCNPQGARDNNGRTLIVAVNRIPIMAMKGLLA